MEPPQLHDLTAIYGCLKRELAFRRNVYPKMVAKGTMGPAKAQRELELMQAAVNYMIDAIFYDATGQGAPAQKEGTVEAWLKERRGQIKALVRKGEL
jgi:hypothetical protein